VSRLFESQTAIISGRAGDIGHAAALEFARLAASVVIGGRRPAVNVCQAVVAIEKHPVRCHYCQVDVADAKAVQDWVNEVETTLGVPNSTPLSSEPTSSAWLSWRLCLTEGATGPSAITFWPAKNCLVDDRRQYPCLQRQQPPHGWGAEGSL
jgi:hypothetical protein